MSKIKNSLLNDDDFVPVMKNPSPAKKDIKQCKYCQREIVWRKTSENKWYTVDVKLHNIAHKDYCFKGEPKFSVGDRIIAFWKSSTIIYSIVRVDKENLTYYICQPKNIRKLYASKNFSFKVLENLSKKLDIIAETLYL